MTHNRAYTSATSHWHWHSGGVA